MIEITIPYWFGAGLLCCLMFLFFGLAFICCYLPYRVNFAVIFIVLIFVCDALAMGLSAGYMTTPIDNSCFTQYNHHYNETPHCVYPKVNPYEQQPLHPILWFLKAGEWVFSGFGKAIKINHGVI